ncbi:hypothetical protein LCM02_11555 [Lutimonas saemankumensis]|uniref:hypothetical protein n=1 Tax=Lutimonas saemankumensis TaxID=483016 RepID=UPI001CD3CF3C|nr:hypothetical protein [Lutimonas saemankumensis]MCA0933091.1 hypothetical protein [Lutimonas saemankumensis]
MEREMKDPSLKEIHQRLTQAFLKFENYLDRLSNNYKYFGFSEWILSLLEVSKEEEKFEVENYKRIADYWLLIDYYRQKFSADDFQRNTEYYNDNFLQDGRELMVINAALFDDFLEFDLDKNPLSEMSIKDIIRKDHPNIYNEKDISDSKLIDFSDQNQPNKHSNIFVGNAFEVWQSMFDEFEIAESNRADIKFMFEEMKFKGLIHKNVKQVDILEWINETYELTIEKTSRYQESKERMKAFERAYSLFKK